MILLRGKWCEAEVMIKVLNVINTDDVDKLQETERNIMFLESSNVIKHCLTHYYEEINQYVIVNCIESAVNI